MPRASADNLSRNYLPDTQDPSACRTKMSAGTGFDTSAKLFVMVSDAPLSMAAQRSREHCGLGLLKKRASSDLSLTSLMIAESSIQACASASRSRSF